jgi:hypothetical protein
MKMTWASPTSVVMQENDQYLRSRMVDLELEKWRRRYAIQEAVVWQRQRQRRWHDPRSTCQQTLQLSLSYKAEASVLIQMRTEKIGLHGYLHKIKRADEPWCGCGQAYQTVRHIIKDYECLEDTRFTYLGVSYVRDVRIFLRDLQLILKNVRFMLATSLLGQFASFIKTLSLL